MDEGVRAGLPGPGRGGPQARTPLALPLVDDVVNTLEFFVHHEDIRRAQPGWEPRSLDAGRGVGAVDRDQGRRPRAGPAGRGAGDDPPRRRRRHRGAARRLAIPSWSPGCPSEIVLFLFGRDQTRGLSLTGPDTSIASLNSTDLGL